MSTTTPAPRRPVLLSAAIATAGAVLASLAGPAAAGPTPSTDPPVVVPVSRHVPDAPRGADPALGIVDPVAQVIRSRAGDAPLLDREFGPETARQAGPGRYVVQYGAKLYVARVGASPRFVADHAVRSYQVDGPRPSRVVYYEGRSSGTWLTVRRLGNGTVVDRLRVPGGSTPLAYRRGEVWFGRDGRLVTWRPGTDRVRPRGVRAPDELDLGVGAGVRWDGRNDIVYPLRRGARWKSWTLSDGVLLAWSPDGRRVAVGLVGREDGYLNRIEIRDARTGRLQRSFRATRRLPFHLPAVRWESPTRLLVPAETTGGRVVTVRLRVTGAFERAGDYSTAYFGWSSPVWTASGPTTHPYR